MAYIVKHTVNPDYSRPRFNGPANGDTRLDFRTFHYPPSSAWNDTDSIKLDPWGKVKSNAPVRRQMAESSACCNRWQFHYELFLPGADHGEVYWVQKQRGTIGR